MTADSTHSPAGQAALRLGGLVQSDIRRMTRECDRVGGINLGQGVCDLPTPPPVAAGAIEAIRNRKSLYSYPEGVLELRRAIAKKLRIQNQLNADPESEIVVTNGATGAYVAALHALLDPGDGILLFEPFYGYHLNGAILAGLRPVYATLEAPGFKLTEELIRNAVDAGTRAVVLCTPSNPSGKMFSREELEALARVANEKDLLVITDEIYESIRYDGRQHISPASLPELRDRTVTIMGLSKTFSITGWRLGYAFAPKALAAPMILANDLFYVCAPTPLQHGAVAGFDLPESFYDDMRTDYAKKRERLCTALDRAGLPPIVPQGAYYVLADATTLGAGVPGGARAAAMTILEKAGVAGVPGTSFWRPSGEDGGAGERYIRFCYALEEERLDEACRRLESRLKGITT